eukprot:6187230-Pleurochrysis_carterae.AAC.1
MKLTELKKSHQDYSSKDGQILAWWGDFDYASAAAHFEKGVRLQCSTPWLLTRQASRTVAAGRYNSRPRRYEKMVFHRSGLNQSMLPEMMGSHRGPEVL